MAYVVQGKYHLNFVLMEDTRQLSAHSEEMFMCPRMLLLVEDFTKFTVRDDIQ